MKFPDQRLTKELVAIVGIAIPEDVEEIAQVQSETWLATYPNEEFGITRDDIMKRLDDRRSTNINNWRKTIEDTTGNKRTWVVKDENKRVMGFCLAVRARAENKISAIYILPGCQGIGVGQKLITVALEWLGKEKPISLAVAKYNVSAVNFYKKCGFEEAGDIPASAAKQLGEGKAIPEIKMIKQNTKI